MRIKEIFNLALEMGKDVDFRGRERVEELLKIKKRKYEKLSEKEKKLFDLEALENPYLDSRIYHIAEDKEIKKVLVGIDITIEELLLAKELKDIDLVIAHHPVGKGLAFLSDVMELQCDVLNYYGVPINVAEKLMRIRIEEVSRGVHPINHQRVVDGARLLGINFINVHTPADNLAADFLKKKIEKEKPERIEDLMDLLLFCRKENSRKLEEKLKKDDLVSGASIKVRDASIVNKDGVYFYLEGTNEKIEKAKELSKDLAEEILGEEKENVVKILKEEEEKAVEGFGLIIG